MKRAFSVIVNRNVLVFVRQMKDATFRNALGFIVPIKLGDFQFKNIKSQITIKKI